jgi:hypothetical protein
MLWKPQTCHSLHYFYFHLAITGLGTCRRVSVGSDMLCEDKACRCAEVKYSRTTVQIDVNLTYKMRKLDKEAK